MLVKEQLARKPEVKVHPAPTSPALASSPVSVGPLLVSGRWTKAPEAGGLPMVTQQVPMGLGQGQGQGMAVRATQTLPAHPAPGRGYVSLVTPTLSSRLPSLSLPAASLDPAPALG